MEDSRIKLKEIEGQEGSDYINANWVSVTFPFEINLLFFLT